MRSGKPNRRTFRVRTGVFLAVALAWVSPPPASPADPGPKPPFFAEIGARAGLDFAHFNGMWGGRFILEVTGAGSALFDFDNDGDLDVYLVQGGMLGPNKTIADAVLAPGNDKPLTDRLYRNDTTVTAAGTVLPRFVDITAASGIDAAGYGMGVAAADFDADGSVDLYVTNFGPNQLWRNNGNGTFSNVIEKAGVDDPRWSVPVSFVDVDADGWLDIYVGNYIDFKLSDDRQCNTSTGAPDYCGPLAYNPEGDRLFRNRGDGTFEDWSSRSGIDQPRGGALGTVTADFNGDFLPDIYVANDMASNQLWINQGDGTFSDEALFAGCAVNWEGKPEASMGVDAGDIDGDGDEDLIMVHISGETNTLYLNDGNAIFRDQSVVSGLASASWNFTGFGAAWVDFDNDGLLDLLTANGAVRKIETLALAGDLYPLDEPNQLFRNLGNGKFEDVTAQAGPMFELAEVSRGAAFGDVDNDGDVDVLLTNNSGPARLLSNQLEGQAGWIGARALGGGGPRDMLGTRFALERGDGSTLWRRVRTDGSYASASDPRVLMGLGPSSRPSQMNALRVRWPDGRRGRWNNLSAGRYYTLFARTEPGAK